MKKATATRPLTVATLKTLKFAFRIHLNGGDKYSSRIDGNDDYGLRIETHTSGQPNYRILSKTLGVDDAPGIELDLMAEDRDLQGFCDAYNSRNACDDRQLPGHTAQPKNQTPTG